MGRGLGGGQGVPAAGGGLGHCGRGPARQELLVRLPRCGGTGRPATQTGQLPPLPRVRFLHSCRGARAESGLVGCSPHSGVPPQWGLPCSALPQSRSPSLPPHMPIAAAAAPGPPRLSGFSCCLQGLISAWTSLTSCRFFLLATGMRSFGFRGPQCRETLAWGGPCRGTRRMSRRSS